MLETISTYKVQVWVHGLNEKGEHYFLLFLTTEERGAFWQPITGSVEEKESSAQAALRETQEETGLKLDSLPVPIGYEFTFISREKRACEQVFEVEVSEKILKKKNSIQLDPREHQDYKWVLAESALSIVKHESNREALRILLRNINS